MPWTKRTVEVVAHSIVHAISIKQPFVELILQGKKKKEYRSRRTNIRGRVFIYASSTPRADERDWRKCGKDRDEVPYGVVVGTVEIYDCRPNHAGGYAYLLRDPVRFGTAKRPRSIPKPQPCFWRPEF